MSSSLRVQYVVFVTFLQALIPMPPYVLWLILGAWFPGYSTVRERERGWVTPGRAPLVPASLHPWMLSLRSSPGSPSSASASCRFSSLKQICSNQQFPVSRRTQLHVSGSLLVFLIWMLFPTEQKRKTKRARAKPHTLQMLPFFSVSPEPVQRPSACYHFCPARWALSEK